MKKYILILVLISSVAYAGITRLGPGGGGYITGVLVDPADGDIVYMTTDNAGVYKTIDGGNTWTSINNGLTAYRGSSIVFGANTSTLWVSTNTGPFKSTDSGATWVAKRTGFPTLSQLNTDREASSLGEIYVNPQNTNYMLAGCGKTLYINAFTRYNSNCEEIAWISSDAGENWTALDDTDADAPQISEPITVTGLAIDPSDTDKIYIGVSSSTSAENGLYYTADGGTNWVKLTVTTGGELDKITHIECTATAGEVWVSTANFQDVSDGLWFSDDYGANFTNKNAPGYAAEYCRTFKILDTTGPKIIADFETRSHYTTDGGANWTNRSKPSGLGFITDASGLWAIDAIPDGSVIWHGYNVPRKWTTGGGWEQLYTTITAGTPDQYSHRGFLNAVTENIWVSSDGDDILLPAWDYDAFFSTDGGVKWTHINLVDEGDCFNAFYDGTYYYLMCGEGEGGSTTDLYRSATIDGTFTSIEETAVGTNVAGAAFTSGDTNRIFLGRGTSGFSYSDNNGDSWSGNIDPGTSSLYTFAQDPQVPNTIYVGYRANNGYIYKSTDFGATFGSNIGSATMQDIRAIAVSPTDSNKIAVACNGYTDGTGGVYFTTDGGSNWNRIDTNISLPNEDATERRWACSVLWMGSRLYAGFRAQELDSADEKGLFYTDNSGTDWTEVDLPIKMIRGLYGSGGIVYVALDGGGAAEYDPSIIKKIMNFFRRLRGDNGITQGDQAAHQNALAQMQEHLAQ